MALHSRQSPRSSAATAGAGRPQQKLVDCHQPFQSPQQDGLPVWIRQHCLLKHWLTQAEVQQPYHTASSHKEQVQECASPEQRWDSAGVQLWLPSATASLRGPPLRKQPRHHRALALLGRRVLANRQHQGCWTPARAAVGEHLVGSPGGQGCLPHPLTTPPPGPSCLASTGHCLPRAAGKLILSGKPVPLLVSAQGTGGAHLLRPRTAMSGQL